MLTGAVKVIAAILIVGLSLFGLVFDWIGKLERYPKIKNFVEARLLRTVLLIVAIILLIGVFQDINAVREALNIRPPSPRIPPAPQIIVQAPSTSSKSFQSRVGSNNTIVNMPVQTKMGSGNTFVGATDSNGNTILNRGGTAIGNGACADSSSVAVGAGANGGNCANSQHQSGKDDLQTGPITQGQGSITQIGGVRNQATINNPPHNPETGETTYAFDGFCRHFSPGVIAGCPGEEEAFRRFMSLQQARDWDGIVEEADAEIKKVPDWLTPYAFKGMAYFNLGRRDDGIKLLEYVDQKTSSNPDFDEVRNILSETKKTPH